MRKTEDLSYYLIERVKKNAGKKKSTFIIVRFINNSTGERKEVTLTKLRKLIGDKKRFMPSNTLEINRIVDTAIEMGVAPFSDSIKQNDTSLLNYIKDFWNYDTSEYILTKKEETGKVKSLLSESVLKDVAECTELLRQDSKTQKRLLSEVFGILSHMIPLYRNRPWP